MRLIFLGTPEFAVPSLQALFGRGFDVAAVVTQPDRPVGRGQGVRPTPVKEAATRLGLTVLQPPTLRDPDVLALLRSISPDVIVVAAFGQILRRAVLDLPPLGCINLHPSLLPKLRGAAPIQAAIREGMSETGITIMLMNERMDAGPVLAQVRAPIFPDDTAATLGDRLSRLGAELLVDTLPRWKGGLISPRPQNDAEATYSRPLTKEDANVDWSRSAEDIARACRAQTPWPGCQTYWHSRLLRLLSTEALPNWAGSESPGTVIAFSGGAPNRPKAGVVTGQGLLVLRELQLAGKRPLSVEDFLRGQPGFVGSHLQPFPDTT